MVILIAFVGQLCAALAQAARHPRLVRWKDAFLTAELAGVNALPIISLLGFLLGLIMAFQSAIPMRQFGADIYVADLIGLSMLRELGLRRMFLHASSIAFRWPDSGAEFRAAAPLPPELGAVLERLRET